MNDTAARIEELKTSLRLQPHVEGGHYHRFHPSKGAEHVGARHAMTAIHYLLEADECSSWHRVDAEEAWHFVEGEPLELLIYNPVTNRLDRCTLGPLTDGMQAVSVVPAGAWQAARPLGAYALATCLVAPGFQYEGFELLAQDDPLAAHLAGLVPEISF
ncbi:cupin domain-containing protein [Dyella telluris]|uniref:Cupin domain-containing protein n=1 Tax=Dyella telluris TaxID=2763498 RepID=A0A7G8Q8C4_9GAMM|nr:cupin domain-containing protein [Dyella telluris]QNK03032.1 cupin domain-containing protein [Dyella telluris]